MVFKSDGPAYGEEEIGQEHLEQTKSSLEKMKRLQYLVNTPQKRYQDFFILVHESHVYYEVQNECRQLRCKCI